MSNEFKNWFCFITTTICDVILSTIIYLRHFYIAQHGWDKSSLGLEFDFIFEVHIWFNKIVIKETKL